MAETGSDRDPLALALRKSRSTFLSVGLFSAAVNVLMLTGPLFMLQVYDRVLASGSVPTLVALFGLVAALYAFLGLFDFIRNKALARTGYRLDVELAGLAKKAWVSAGLSGGGDRLRPVQDLSTLRQFLASNGLPALFDLPWVPVYLAIVWLLHPWLGLLATVGAVVVIIVTGINEWMTKKPIGEAAGWELADNRFGEQANRNAESILAMGMMGDVSRHWQRLRQRALGEAQHAGDIGQSLTAFTKSVRMLLQSGILALGAYLAIYQEITPGTMIAASILAGRALAPVDLAIANWKGFIRARLAHGRLAQALAAVAGETSPVELPEPEGRLKVSGLIKLPPQDDKAQTGQKQIGQKQIGKAKADSKPILQGIDFELEPGDGLGVIGPSASGKSSLARLLTGLWLPDRGVVTLDGARFDQWEKDRLGRFIGYLPQSVSLLPGTIRQNIARFDEEIGDNFIIEAAKLAGVHELILSLPDGYSTDLSKGMHTLSGGQIQRIALARAVLRSPPLVVLDEPNSNLDAEGDAALAQAIARLREQGSCVVVMAHRPSAIAAVNKVLMLDQGRQTAFGPKEEVLRKVTRPVPAGTMQTKPPKTEQAASSQPSGSSRPDLHVLKPYGQQITRRETDTKAGERAKREA